MSVSESTLTREQLERALAQVAVEVPDASLDVVLVLLSAALGVHKSTVRRHFLKHKLTWNVERPKAASIPCAVCSKPSRARGLCSEHHRMDLRYRPAQTPSPERQEPPKLPVQDCDAVPNGLHLWVINKGIRMCFYCREPFGAIMRRRKECS